MHPYRGAYSMLLAPLKDTKIEFMEIGIADGGSARMWTQFFERANLHFYDFSNMAIENLKQQCLPGISEIGYLDVSKDGNVESFLKAKNKMFDIILDDSSHIFEDQVRVANEAWAFIKSGGYLLIEDVQRKIPEHDFEIRLSTILNECSLAYFIECNHEERYSPDSNDDKILVIVK